MFGSLANGLATLSLKLRQPLTSFCDLESSDGEVLVGKRGESMTLLQVQGLRKMTLRRDVEVISEALRLDLAGSLDDAGHALQGFFACDPAQSGPEIERNLRGARTMAREIGLSIPDIFDERSKIWPKIMRSEAAFLAVWSKPSLLTREEKKQSKTERLALSKGSPRITDAQNPFLSSEILSARHAAFISRVVGSFRTHGIGIIELTPAEALVAIREAIDPNTAGSEWKPILPGSPVRPRLPEDGEKGDAGLVLWPPIADQLFRADAETHGGQRVRIGGFEWSSVDLTVGPEDARPFAELVGKLAHHHHLPWRMSMLVEGGGKNMMRLKSIFATVLGFVPSNRQIHQAFTALRLMRENNTDVLVKVRTSFATWAPEGEVSLLRRNASTLAQQVEGWGNCMTGVMAGDPLEGVMSSTLALAVASTAPAAAAPLGEVLRMMPWGRPASPWSTGSVLFRTPDGRMWPFDPAGSKRKHTMDLFIAPSRFGKSVLSNTILLGLCLSSAAQTTQGARLPLIGKLDIGPSAEGLILLIQEALPAHRRNEAAYVAMQLADGYEFNIFDTQIGCRFPLPLEKDFIQNMLSLGCMPIGADAPFEGMDQLVGFAIEEAYRFFSDSGPGKKRPKKYLPGIEPAVDTALRKLRFAAERDTFWWEVVDALCRDNQHHLAGIAQRHAVPLLDDLISAVRSQQIQDMFGKVVADTEENLPELFERYITALIKKYQTLNRPTKLDFGPARVIVLDLEYVAPTGSAEADRQTDLMYLLGRHVLARNFFLRPKYLPHVPELVREYHRVRFTEVYETYKRLEYDEYQRTEGRRYVRRQVEQDGREGGKHNLQLGVSSQRMRDLGDYLISQSTGRFVLGAGDEDEKEDIIKRFGVSAASAEVIRRRLNGPTKGGAPFMALVEADNEWYEQMLVNSLGPVELWAFSTSPQDVALRSRLYRVVGPAEARRRLARVFPNGSAKDEIVRRKEERQRGGEDEARASLSVVQDLADELVNGHGLGIVLRGFEAQTQQLQPAE